MQFANKAVFEEVTREDDNWWCVDIKWPLKWPRSGGDRVEANISNLEYQGDWYWRATITLHYEYEVPGDELQRLVIVIDNAELSVTEQGMPVFADHDGPVKVSIEAGDYEDPTVLCSNVIDIEYQTLVNLDDVVYECCTLVEEVY